MAAGTYQNRRITLPAGPPAAYNGDRVRVYPFLRWVSSFSGRLLAFAFLLSLLLAFLWLAGNAQGFLDATQRTILAALHLTLLVAVGAGAWTLGTLVARCITERRVLVVRLLLALVSLAAGSLLLASLGFLQAWLRPLICWYTAPMPPFRLDLPATVLFGPGTFAELPGLVRRYGRRVLLVTGAAWLERSGRLARLAQALSEAAIERHACPAGEPTTDAVEEARRHARAFKPEVIVAVGGGSALDTAKALSGLLASREPVERFLEGIGAPLPVPGPGVPWIAVPTTAGTGAEASRNAVLRVKGAGLKRSLRSPHLLAAAVLVDPELTVDLPPAVTGTCGLDAVTQLVEAHVSRKANPFTSSLVRGAFLPLLEALDGLVDSPGNIGLRTAASYGAFVSGIALANAGLGAAHGFASGMGGMFDIPHGLLCAVFLPHVLEANADVIRDRVAELAAGRGGRADPVEWLGDTVRRLLVRYGLPADLCEYRVPVDQVPIIVERSAGSSMKGNPKDLARDEQARIVRLVAGRCFVIRAARGAIQVAADAPEAINQAGTRLVRAVLEANELAESDLVSLVFSLTVDLSSANPATGLRRTGFADVPLFCVQEAVIAGSMPRVIRLLATFEVPAAWAAAGRTRSTAVYLEGARALRTDLYEGRA